jgi:hypothetical protein
VDSEVQALGDDLRIQKEMFTKRRSSVAECEERQNFVTRVSGCPLLLLLFPFAWTQRPRVACIGRRDSLIFTCVLIATATSRNRAVCCGKSASPYKWCMSCVVNDLYVWEIRSKDKGGWRKDEGDLKRKSQGMLLRGTTGRDVLYFAVTNQSVRSKKGTTLA